MKTRTYLLCAVITGLSLDVTSSSAQDAKGVSTDTSAAFIEESRDLLQDLARLQLSDVPRLGSVAKCLPKPPQPDSCPPLCPQPPGISALRSYSEGKASHVASAIQRGVTIEDSLICDPGFVEKQLNELVSRLDRIGAWVVRSDRRGVTITGTPPAARPGAGAPELKASATRDRAFAALNYMNAAFAKGGRPNVRTR